MQSDFEKAKNIVRSGGSDMFPYPADAIDIIATALAQAREEEREECAKVAELTSTEKGETQQYFYKRIGGEIAAAIRARGGK